MVVDLHEEAAVVQGVFDLLPGFRGGESGQRRDEIRFGLCLLQAGLVEPCEVVKDRQPRKRVALTCFKVIEVVSRSDLDGSGSKFQIDQDRISDDRDLPARKRQAYTFADEMPISLVFGMHGDRRIAQEGFRSCCGDGQERFRIIRNVIADVVKLALDLFVFDLDVGQCRQAARAPVDEPLASIDQTFFVEAHEDLEHRFGQALVHRKAETVPVAGFTQLLLLIDDGVARGGLPLPHPFDEAFTPE